ncbi:MAG: isoprenyl transferase [Tannerellaceae bacterium]
MSLLNNIDLKRLPRHVAVIMDGNGRWAKMRGLERYFGHSEGVVSVKKIIESASKLGIKYMTLYTFSTENWKRPEEEIQALMGLLVQAINQETAHLMEHNIRLTAIGDLSRLPEDAKVSLNECMEATALNTGVTVALALSYSSRWEITNAIKEIAQMVVNNEMSIDQINDKVISSHLTTHNLPDPDLLIRTGGEKRISNFMLWQLSYTELFFSDKFWPEFREEEFYEAILEFQNRERRLGRTSEQLIK